jgi:hypothetical protein
MDYDTQFCSTCGMSQAELAHSSAQTRQSDSFQFSTGMLPPTCLLNQRYRLIETVGRGGMGAVYARMEDVERHVGHSDPQWIEQNKERLLQGQLTPLALDGPVIEIDTTTPDNFDYADLLGRVRVALPNTRTG